MNGDIIFRKEQWRGTITLNRPAKLNALTIEMLVDVRTALDDCAMDPEIRVVVLRGEGRAFSAGFDISPSSSKPTSSREWRQHLATGNATFMAIWELHKPVIAQVQGVCLGGAFDLMVACDLAVCSDDATFGLPEVRYGGSSQFLMLPWSVGPKIAKQLLLTGGTIGASQAAQYQLVNAAVPADELAKVVDGLAATVARVPNDAVAANKRVLNRVYELMGIREGVSLSEDLAVLLLSDPSDEAVQFNDLIRREGLTTAIKRWESRFR
jgi:enoyl-CoA hydratase/carnithine racemase